MSNINSHNGFTLMELMVTITIAMILASIGVPGLQKTIQKNRMSALHNELLAALNMARSTAITRGSWATLCISNASASDCDLSATGWANGWIVFPDKNNNGSLDAGEQVVALKRDIPGSIDIISSRPRITYGANGYAVGYTGKITFCDARGDSAKSGMVISNTGRVRVASSEDTLAICK